MLNSATRKMVGVVLLGLACAVPAQAADEVRYKPFILGSSLSGTMEQVINSVRNVLKANGFEEAGYYLPYSGAAVIVVTNPELRAAAARVELGGFGAGERVAVTDVKGKIQVSYVNPAYIGSAYGLGKLEGVAAKLKVALGAQQEFGAETGLTADQLAPGTYHYQIGMPYFNQVDSLAKYADHATAVSAVEKGLAVGKGGTRKVYRIDLSANVSVFGVGIVTGDGIDKGAKDTDKEIMDILDYQDLKSTAYLPYEIMVKGREVIALRGRYRIALNFPDTKMMGAHGFTKIMSAPSGIKDALEAVAAGEGSK